MHAHVSRDMLRSALQFASERRRSLGLLALLVGFVLISVLVAPHWQVRRAFSQRGESWSHGVRSEYANDSGGAGDGYTMFSSSVAVGGNAPPPPMHHKRGGAMHMTRATAGAQPASADFVTLGGGDMSYTAETGSYVPSMSPTPDLAFDSDAGVGSAQQRMVVRNGELDVYVRDVPTAERRVRGMVASLGGFVSSMTTSTPLWNHPSLLDVNLTVRVPVDVFDKVVDDLKSLSVYISRIRMSSDDVSEQYVDMKARAENLEASRDGLLRLLDRVDNVATIVAVRRELRMVTGELESMKARLRYLLSASSLSTLQVWLRLDPSQYPREPEHKPQPPQTWTPLTPVRRALMFLAELIVHIVNSMLFTTTLMAPFIAIGTVLWHVISCLCCRRGRKSSSSGVGSAAAAAAGSGSAHDRDE